MKIIPVLMILTLALLSGVVVAARTAVAGPAIVVFHDFTFVVMESITYAAHAPTIKCINKGVSTTFEVGQKGSEVIAVLVLSRAPTEAARDLSKAVRYNVPPSAQVVLKQHVGRICVEASCVGLDCGDCQSMKTTLLKAMG